MAGQLHHPDTGKDTDGGTGRRALTPRQRWSRIVVVLVVAALFLAMIVLHLTGTFGPGSNG